jgi:hypothetical protein
MGNEKAADLDNAADGVTGERGWLRGINAKEPVESGRNLLGESFPPTPRKKSTSEHSYIFVFGMPLRRNVGRDEHVEPDDK